MGISICLVCYIVGHAPKNLIVAHIHLIGTNVFASAICGLYCRNMGYDVFVGLHFIMCMGMLGRLKGFCMYEVS